MAVAGTNAFEAFSLLRSIDDSAKSQCEAPSVSQALIAGSLQGSEAMTMAGQAWSSAVPSS